jgi:hypothetical protein
MDSQQVVDFVVRGIDDFGKPSRALLEVAEVGVMSSSGKMLGRFRDADALGQCLISTPGRVRLVALETAGLPRFDISGKYVCCDQADFSLCSERPHD